MIEQGAEKEEMNGKKVKRLKRAVFLLFIAILIGGLYLFWLKLQQPSIGTVRVDTGTTEADPIMKAETKHYSGHYVSFSVPEHFVEKSHTVPADGPVREMIFLSSSETEGKKIAVVVEERLNESLEESPGYQMRLMKPKVYKQDSYFHGDIEALVFAKDSQVYEVTAFFRFHKKIVSVSVSSPIRMETLREDLEALLASIQWAG